MGKRWKTLEKNVKHLETRIKNERCWADEQYERKRDWGFGRLILFNINNKCFLETSYHLQIMAECDPSGPLIPSPVHMKHPHGEWSQRCGVIPYEKPRFLGGV